MTREEAIVYFERRKKQYGLSDNVQEAENMAIEALEKQVPKFVKCPKGWRGIRYTRYYCPNCNKILKMDEKWCNNCGQHIKHPKKKMDGNNIVLDWSDTE